MDTCTSVERFQPELALHPTNERSAVDGGLPTDGHGTPPSALPGEDGNSVGTSTGDKATTRANGNNVEDAPYSIVCPISLSVMRDPVTDAFGHTYERYSLAQALAKRPNVSPLTNAPYPNNNPSVTPNPDIKAAADAFLRQTLQKVAKEHGAHPQTPPGRTPERQSLELLPPGSPPSVSPLDPSQTEDARPSLDVYNTLLATLQPRAAPQRPPSGVRRFMCMMGRKRQSQPPRAEVASQEAPIGPELAPRSPLEVHHAQMSVQEAQRTPGLQSVPLQDVLAGNVRHLNVSSLNLNLPELRSLTRALVELAHLETVSVTKSVELPVGALRQNQAADLDLSRRGLKEGDAVVLAGALARNLSVHTLNLEYNKMGMSGTRELAQVLTRRADGLGNSSLTSLDLSWNALGAGGAEALARALAPNQSGLVCTVSSLTLRGNQVGARGAEALFAALRPTEAGVHGACMHQLDLSWNDLGGAGGLAAAAALTPDSRGMYACLSHLLLRGNKMRDEGARAIVEALNQQAAFSSYTSSVEFLDIWNNELSKQFKRSQLPPHVQVAI
uniref:U-box domain-containing protein n=1 Tax=Pyramimonas obovata TaxID=1411642 RepID=A0A7S0MR26_9CHLO|mmetsp:Transcript_11392/g.23810  ORF Transcript_11392/g.23810 Transcript_11392/m.23810 type:complete len:557 (+) Transcript_11392:266-1936(+)|eukprot:CAMPEP_0118924538 /NCGR_PEP_ID=MMETSP1169-20130426/2628_1 /TAXON_ID=36882 /ORGANISM="Pyramimonas obovata, Strain CCMP722" /LENGTH=556 /DNA_ID=CAMNT_0006865663 /DNA_START=266 /DNA_END=1936 /DNA_ORIENTATION=-